MKITLFKNAFAETPVGSITLEDFLDKVISGYWRKPITNLRLKGKQESTYKKLKSSLPAVTVSAELKNRDKNVPVNKRIKTATGLICLDIDKKDNPKLKGTDLVDKECLAQFLSCGGEGIKIIYRCKPTKEAAEHRRIYDAAVARLEAKGIKLKVDPIVKSVASLQYVSYDPDAYYFPKSKLVIKPLPPKKVKFRPPSEDVKKEIEQLEEYIKAVGKKDVTKNYEDWLNIAFGLSYNYHESGREVFHKLSSNYAHYDPVECNELYDACLERDLSTIETPITIASVFQVIGDNIPKPVLKQLNKKYNVSHAVGVGEETEQGDLSGMVRYKLFLFKKIVDKKTHEVIDLVPDAINLNNFEVLLREKGFFRFNKLYVQIIDNIVEVVDEKDIMRIVTEHVEKEGNYTFTYNSLEFNFSWEELAYLWRKNRGSNSFYNQIPASLTHWMPNLLKDNATESFIPYLNGVLKVTKNKTELIPYGKIQMQIWRERILPREYKYTTTKGMFEIFFENVCGRGNNNRARVISEHYKRSLWYFGYMLQGTKRQSTARAWILYDIKPGNEGRTGKTILGQAIGKIRNMVTLDGKQIDFKNRFAFQTVQPWTDVVFIDDPSKYMSLQPLFNMITGELAAEGKNAAPIVKSVKFMLASNWVLETGGRSEIERQFITQADDFYVRWGKEHNNTLTPIVDYHGKEFFTDWDLKDWSQFDSFCAKALQYHLKAEPPKNNVVGNAKMVRFIQLHDEEMFFELATEFCSNVVKGKDGSLLIAQGLLMEIVKAHHQQFGQTKAGRIVRDFLTCIGGVDVSITSMIVGSMSRMAYKIQNDFKSLNFDKYSKNLPKPNF